LFIRLTMFIPCKKRRYASSLSIDYVSF